MRIAMLGLKGLPAKWGGIEKYVEEIGKRLVQRGHEVMVFGSRWYCGKNGAGTHLGIKVRAVPALHLRSTDALSNALLSALLIAKGDYDIVHFHGYASYYFIPLVRRFGKRTVITAHGFESGWNNPKYGSAAKNMIKQAFRKGITGADCVTTVAAHLRDQIMDNFRVESIVVPSGIAEEPPLPPKLITEKYGLRGADYILFLGRIDPIKRVDWVVDLSRIVAKDLRVVIAGGPQDSASAAYYSELAKSAGQTGRCIFTGPVSGQEKTELLSNCLLFTAPSENEGLPISLLEASSFERCCLASDIPAHREVIDHGFSGFLFEGDRRQVFLEEASTVLKFPIEKLRAIGAAARMKTIRAFNWNDSVRILDETYMAVLNK